MKTEMQIQKENVAKLLKLIAENPDLRVLPMVDSEIVADDGYNRWTAVFGSAQVDEVVSMGERIYIRSDDEEQLINEAYDKLYDDKLTDKEAEKKAESIVGSYEWEKVILVNINES
ncbi:hypothetical protein [Paenibacillus senegalimassiliensis]|uniref:hypothetical protein n=1 Tax=Paenibacillus senegalimassiliensis TaxID=1737426 RepID=UPI000B0C8676|nr:hypothetical protein [Paenibacillus senegalimassiliensis]